MKVLLGIAAGGAVGAVLRYLVMSWVSRIWGHEFPIATLLVNVLGCFILGILVEMMALRWPLGDVMRAFLVVGIMGGFTTFSAFSLDVVVLAERGQMMAAFGYIMASVVLAVGGFWLGLALMRSVL